MGHHDITWRNRAIFTDRRPVPWRLVLAVYVVLGVAAFLTGVLVGATP